MRIDTIHIDGFGLLSDRHYELSGPLTLFYGANEAGKSTTMAFIRAVLFGFPSRQNLAGRYEPARGGAHGGWLALADDDGRRLRAARYAGAPGGRSASGGVVTLAGFAAQGASAYEPAAHAGDAAEGELRSWLGGISPELYRSLFAFGLSELQELSTLQSEEISGYLYSAGWGASGRAIAAAERKLLQDMERLYKRRGQNPELNRTLKRAEELTAELRRSGDQTALYNDMIQQLKLLDEQIREEEAQLQRLRELGAFEERALRCVGPYARYRELHREFAELPRFEAFPQDALPRFEELKREQAAEQEARERALLQIARTEELVAANPLKPEVLEYRNERELTAGRAAEYLADQSALEELRLERLNRDRELRQLLAEIDEAWTEKELMAFPVTVAEREKVREAQSVWDLDRTELARLTGEKDRLARQLSSAEQSLREQTERLEAASGRRWSGRSTIEPTREQLDRLATLSEQWKEAQADWQLAVQRVEDARRYEEQGRRAEQQHRERNQKLRAQLNAALAGVLTAGVAGGLIYMDKPVIAAASVILGAAVILYLLWPKRERDRRSSTDTAAFDFVRAVERQAKRLHDIELAWLEAAQPVLELRHAAAARAEYTSEPEAWSSFEPRLSLDALREGMRSVENWRHNVSTRDQEQQKLQDQSAFCDSLRAQLKQLEQDMSRLEEHRSELKRNWQAWLEQLRLPLHVSPSTALEVFRLAEQGKRILSERMAIEARAALKASLIDQFHQDVIRWFGDEAGEDPVRYIQAWKEEAARQISLAEAHAKWESELAERKDEAALLEDRLERIQASILSIWSEAGAEAEEDFRRRVYLFDRYTTVKSELNELDAWFDTIAGSEGREKLLELLASSEEESLREKVQQGQERLRLEDQRRAEHREQRGILTGEIAKLEQGEEHAERLLRLEEARSALHDQIRKWGTMALSAALFRRSKEQYERERQPAVLRRASEHIQMLTNGRYVRVLSPIGSNQIRVQRSDGEHLDPAYLSRGTAEQLYLAVRFALAEEYARTKKPLPLVLDDVFVNFDKERLVRSLNVLREVSKQHQVLLFTCHAYLRDAVQELIPEQQTLIMD
jgi:uncharacterized protein YhaN